MVRLILRGCIRFRLCLRPFQVHMGPLDEIGGTQFLRRQLMKLFFLFGQGRKEFIKIGRKRSGLWRQIDFHF